MNKVTNKDVTVKLKKGVSVEGLIIDREYVPTYWRQKEMPREIEILIDGDWYNDKDFDISPDKPRKDKEIEKEIEE